MRSVLFAVLFVTMLVGDSTQAAAPLGSGWTYQGHINEMGSPMTGMADFEFTLHDAATLGGQVGSIVAIGGVDVVDGVFTVQLDFGVSVFQGDARWLEISVKETGGGAFTVLAPRQLISATPYSIQTRGIFVDDAANVGLGTAAPAQKLHVNGNARVDGWIGTDVDQEVTIRVNDVQAMRIWYSEFDEDNGLQPTPNITGGSSANYIHPDAFGSVIAGGGYEETNGFGNYIPDSFCAILGGRNNQAGDNDLSQASEVYATVAGGFRNGSIGKFSFIGGGDRNWADGEGSSVAGGSLNSAAHGPGNFVGGGMNNTMFSNDNSYSTIAGGLSNRISGAYSAVPGGHLNRVMADYGFAAGRRAVVDHTGGFVWADSTDASFSTTGPDQFLVRAGGGIGLNTDTPLGTVHVRELDLGLDASLISNDDLVVESDDAIMGLYSTGSGSWSSGVVFGEVDAFGTLVDKWAMVRQTNGASSRLQLTYGTSAAYASNSQVVSINKTGQVGLGILPFFPLHMASGAHVTAGGTWTNASSRTLKENFVPVDRRAILDQVMDMTVSRWNYKSEGEAVEHIGPMAEDFAAAFATGETETAIATVDADGVALASIQALYEFIQAKDAEIDSLRSKTAEMGDRLAEIERMLARED